MGGCMMKTNLSEADRVLRILTASLLISMSVTGITGAWAFYIGLAALVSSAFSFCLIYWILGIDQCESSNLMARNSNLESQQTH